MNIYNIMYICTPNSKFDGRAKGVTRAEVSSWIDFNKADNTLLVILWLVSCCIVETKLNDFVSDFEYVSSIC